MTTIEDRRELNLAEIQTEQQQVLLVNVSPLEMYLSVQEYCARSEDNTGRIVLVATVPQLRDSDAQALWEGQFVHPHIPTAELYVLQRAREKAGQAAVIPATPTGFSGDAGELRSYAQRKQVIYLGNISRQYQDVQATRLKPNRPISMELALEMSVVDSPVSKDSATPIADVALLHPGFMTSDSAGLAVKYDKAIKDFEQSLALVAAGEPEPAVDADQDDYALYMLVAMDRLRRDYPQRQFTTYLLPTRTVSEREYNANYDRFRLLNQAWLDGVSERGSKKNKPIAEGWQANLEVALKQYSQAVRIELTKALHNAEALPKGLETVGRLFSAPGTADKVVLAVSGQQLTVSQAYFASMPTAAAVGESVILNPIEEMAVGIVAERGARNLLTTDWTPDLDTISQVIVQEKLSDEAGKRQLLVSMLRAFTWNYIRTAPAAFSNRSYVSNTLELQKLMLVVTTHLGWDNADSQQLEAVMRTGQVEKLLLVGLGIDSHKKLIGRIEELQQVGQ